MSKRSWMTDLDELMRDTPLIYLAIPGSHNSMTYGITSKSPVAPDAPLNPVIFKLFRFVIKRWCINQSANVESQLNHGVRYFDLRIALQKESFHFAHGLYSMEISDPLREIRHFADQMPGEVVILDFQHFYGMSDHHHHELQKMLLNLFGKRLYTSAHGDLSGCTLNECTYLNKNVVLIYRRSPVPLPKEFWPSKSWPTPWPNISSAKALRAYLDHALKSRDPSCGYVSQCVLTPSGGYIAKRLCSSLVQTAKNVNKKLHPWIEEQSPGPFEDHERAKVNVFLADFVDLRKGEFCNWVISLNDKLLAELREQKHNEIARQQLVDKMNARNPCNNKCQMYRVLVINMFVMVFIRAPILFTWFM